MKWGSYIGIKIGVSVAKCIAHIILSHVHASKHIGKHTWILRRGESLYQDEEIVPLALGIGPPKMTDTVRPVNSVIL